MCVFLQKQANPAHAKKYHNRCFIPYEPTKKWLLHWIILYIIVRNISKENYCRLAVRGIAPTIFLYHPDQLVPRFIPLWYFSPAFLPSLRSAYWMPHEKLLQIKGNMCSEANSFFETSTVSHAVANSTSTGNALLTPTRVNVHKELTIMIGHYRSNIGKCNRHSVTTICLPLRTAVFLSLVC